jgi:hypothetical protein
MRFVRLQFPTEARLPSIFCDRHLSRLVDLTIQLENRPIHTRINSLPEEKPLRFKHIAIPSDNKRVYAFNIDDWQRWSR